MRQHNLELGEGSKDRTLLMFENFQPWAKGAQWEYIIADALGELSACEVYWYGEFERFTLVGTVGDLEALRYFLEAVRQQRVRAWLEYKKTGPDGLWSFSFSFARALEGKVHRLLVGAPEIAAKRQQAKLWYESTRRIIHENLIGGPGASAAGRAAGANVSLHRGEVGRPTARLTHARRLR